MELTQALLDAQGAIAAVCLGKLQHPAYTDYQNWMGSEDARKQAHKAAARSQSFTEHFDVDILPGDHSLLEDHLGFIMRTTKNDIANSEERRRVMVDLATLLLKLVILRVYLQRSWGDDFQIYYLAHKFEGTELSKIRPDDPFADAKRGRIIRHLTIPEQVLLATEGMNTRTGPRKAPEFCKIQRKVSTTATIPADYLLASAFYHDESGYVWAPSSTQGLFQERRDPLAPRSKPKPKPKSWLSLPSQHDDADTQHNPVENCTSANLKRGRDGDEEEEEQEEEEGFEAAAAVDGEHQPLRRSLRKRPKLDDNGEDVNEMQD